MTLNQRSLDNLKGVHPDLVRVVKRAAENSPVPFVVTEGLRNLERQKMLKAAGKSKTLDSRHLTGHAVDLVDANDFKYDEPDMEDIAKAMKAAAAVEKVPIEWGPDMWGWDSPHFQLPKSAYPASGLGVVTKVKEVAAKVVTSKTVVAVTGTAAGTAVSTAPVSAPSIPAPPDLSAVSAWKSFGQTIADLTSWASGHPGLTVAIGAWVISLIFWDQIKAGWQAWRAA